MRQAGRTAAVVGLTTAALALGLAVPASAAKPGPGGSATATATPSAQVWTTKADGTQRLRATTVAAATSRKPAPLTVDLAATGQTVTGFGAALTHSSAHLLAAMPAADRRRLLEELFSPTGPVRLSVVRVPLGSSDFVVGTHFTYDDVPAGTTDPTLASFSTARDEQALRPVLREIRAIAPDVLVLASPWSAPAWMKESGNLLGGRLRQDAVPLYADYLVAALADWRSAGLPVDVLTVQNEPQTRWPGDYPRMEMPAAQQVAVVRALGPRLAAAGLDVDVLAFDHNWSQHPGDLSAVLAGQDPENDYVARVLGSDAAPWLSGVAFHCYYGDASAQDAVRAQFPAAQIWMTECSGSFTPGDSAAKIFSDTLMWQGRNVLVDPLRSSATGVLTWNLALDRAGGPRNGGCGTCTGVVTVDGGTLVGRNAEYHVLAHGAQAVPRGAVRVGASTAVADVRPVAFRAPDGATVVLVHHGASRAQTVDVTVEGRTWPVTLPARSLVTVKVPRLG